MSTLYSLPSTFTEGHFDPSSIATPGTTFFRELDPYRLYLKYDETKIPDGETARKFLWCPPGKVVVEMLQAPEKVGELYIPERMRETYHHDITGEAVAGIEPSVGVVLAVGEDVDLDPGMKVLVIDGDGVAFRGFKTKNYEAMGEVRMYGLVVPDSTEHWSPPYEGYVESLPADQSLVAILDGMTVIPSGRNILIKKDPFETKTESGLIIPDCGQERTSIGTVIRCGPDCEDVRPGHRIVFHPLTELSFVDSDDDSLRMIREETVLCILLGEEAA